MEEPLEEKHQHKESNQRLERSNPIHQEAIESKLKFRKERIDKFLFDKRVSSSTHIQSYSKIEEEQDELLKPRGKGYLPLHQHQRKFHSFYRKKKQRKCWYCRSWYHLKKDCPRICCFFCGYQGHIKRNCFKWELHRAIQELKKITGKAVTETEEKKKYNKSKTKYDEVEFKEKGGKHYMFHKGQELAMYIGNKPFQEAKRGFERPRLPKWKMEKAIYEDIPRRKLKLSDYLPHQCGKCGEVLDGHTFLSHIDSQHNGFCPTGSLINASPYRYWLLWYNDENFLRFRENRNPNYIKADPPWLI